MRKPLFLIAAAALCVTFAAKTEAMPLSGAGVLPSAVDSLGLAESVQYRVYAGRRYCFYPDGWHGPGWYRCGYSWRRGFGWGGVYGWNNWYEPGIELRFGHRNRGHHWRGHRGNRDAGRNFQRAPRGTTGARPGGGAQFQREGGGGPAFRGGGNRGGGAAIGGGGNRGGGAAMGGGGSRPGGGAMPGAAGARER